MAAAVTPEAVATVIARHFRSPRWNPPLLSDCAAIAAILRRHSGTGETAAPRRREVKANRASIARLREALGEDLPALAGRVLPILAEGEHQRAMTDLVAVGERFLALYAGGSDPPRQAREWHALVNVVAPSLRWAVMRSNPGRRVGIPRSARSPVALAAAGLLRMAGVPETVASPGAIGRHFVGFWPGPS